MKMDELVDGARVSFSSCREKKAEFSERLKWQEMSR